MTKRDLPPLILSALAVIAGGTFFVLSRMVNDATADLGKSLQPKKPVSAATITAVSLDAALRSDGKPLVIDTREKEAFDQGHIPSSIQMDHTTFVQQRGKFLLAGVGTPVVLVCARDTACEEANLLHTSLVDLAFTDLSYLVGGYDAWKSASLPESTESLDPNTFIDIVGEQLVDVPSIALKDALQNANALWVIITPFDDTSVLSQVSSLRVSTPLSSLHQEVQKSPLKDAPEVYVVSSSLNQAKIAAMKVYSDLNIPSAVVLLK